MVRARSPPDLCLVIEGEGCLDEDLAAGERVVEREDVEYRDLQHAADRRDIAAPDRSVGLCTCGVDTAALRMDPASRTARPRDSSSSVTELANLRRSPAAIGIVLACVVAAPFVTTAQSGVATNDPAQSSLSPAGPSRGTVLSSDISGRLAIAMDSGIGITDASFEQVRGLTDDGGFDPTWSPDGTRIAYRLLLGDDDGEIWVADVASGASHDLVNDPGFSDWGPDWSPDGTQIAYSSNREVGGIAVFVMAADGSDQHAVTQGHGEYPSWSPDGRRIAYAGGDHYDIRIVNADGSDDRQLTTGPAYDMYPAWSPDGQWIAYETQADHYPVLTEPGMGPEMEIHIVRPDGADDRRITNDDVEDYFPAWTADGRYLTWVRHGVVVAARPDGSGMTELGNGNFPDWSA